MMPEAHIVHDGYGFRCATLNLALPLALGLDGSAVLHQPGALPEGWLTAAPRSVVCRGACPHGHYAAVGAVAR